MPSPSLSSQEVARIKGLAEKAKAKEANWYKADDALLFGFSSPDAAHIVAMSPDVALALVEEVRRHQWQPIETAPVGGDAYVLVVSDREFIRTCRQESPGEWRDDHGMPAFNLTHWMPLPELPKGAP